MAKSTLINWSREHQPLIQNLRAIEWEDFADRTLASKQERLKALAEQLRRLDAELAQRNLALVSTTQLHSMAEQLRRRRDRECGPTLLSDGVTNSRDDDTRQADFNSGAFGRSRVLSGGLPVQLDHAPPPSRRLLLRGNEPSLPRSAEMRTSSCVG